MESPPCMHHKVSKYETEWSSFIKIFEGERFVFISGKIKFYANRGRGDYVMNFYEPENEEYKHKNR